jgi:2-aminoadipate transaminase
MMKNLSARAKGVSASAIREILKITEKPGIISLAGGLPSPALFPIPEIRHALTEVMQTTPQACLQYGATEGVMELRQWVAQAHASPQYPLSADHVLITTGSQQALDLLSKAFIDPGDRVLTETPSYLGAIQAMSLYQPRFEVLPERGGMIDVLTLAQQRTSCKFIYLIPNFQNPTGRLMNLETRKALANYSQEHGQVLIEDDPYGEIQFEATGLPSLFSLCPENTIHLGSFSKILAPGLRVGYVVANPEIIRKLTLLKQSADLHTPSLNQRLVLELLQQGIYEQQVAAVRQHYKKQCHHMIAAIGRHFPSEVRLIAPRGGMFVWCELPDAVNTTELLEESVREKVAFVPGEYFYVKQAKTNTLRLSFATTPPEKIDAAIEILGKLIADRLSHTPSMQESVPVLS